MNQRETMAGTCDPVVFSVDCPCRLLFDQIADKWSMMILAVLEGGPTRFNALKRSIEGVPQKSLAQTLRRLERNGVITRRIIASQPVGVEYALSPIGQSLLAPMRALYRWTKDNHAAVEAARAAFDERATG